VTIQPKSLEEVELKLLEIKLLEEKEKLRVGLPHLYAWKYYKWAREFIESHNKICLLTAGNQLSKSSSQIRKCIEWATNKSLWPMLWPKNTPRSFLYLYPSTEVALVEFKQKWETEFMPSGEYKDHPVYGWTFSEKHKAIYFNSGVTVFFKSYSQDASNLQTITAHAVFCDEELPVELYDEIMFRLAAADGYFSMVFTATLGQEFWRRAMECQGNADETLAGAAKWQVSAYDCLSYDDGTPSPWTVERIQRLERNCKSHNEVLKRIYGRFVKDEGLKYPTYDSIVHRKPQTQIPDNWVIYAGVDGGSGGVSGHPAGIVFVAINQAHTEGRVIKAWRGDGIVTTAADVLMKYLDLKSSLKRSITRAFFDWAYKDFGTIAARIGEPFEPAEKSHELGEEIINSLFKNNALVLDQSDIEIDKLSLELASLSITTDKRKAKDNLADALRYALTKIPFDWHVITGGEVAKQKQLPSGGVDELLRRGLIKAEDLPGFEESTDIDAELREWDGLLN